MGRCSPQVMPCGICSLRLWPALGARVHSQGRGPVALDNPGIDQQEPQFVVWEGREVGQKPNDANASYFYGP